MLARLWAVFSDNVAPYRVASLGGRSRSSRLHFDVWTNLLTVTRTKLGAVKLWLIFKKLVHLHCSISDQISRLFVIFERKMWLVNLKPKWRLTFWRSNEPPNCHRNQVRSCQIVTLSIFLVQLHCCVSCQISRLFVIFERKLYSHKIKLKLRAIFWRLNESSSCQSNQVSTCQIMTLVWWFLKEK